jgi:hypothetical protein
MAVLTYADITTLTNSIYEDALVVARENMMMDPLIRVFRDRAGMAPRNVTQYGTASVFAVGETDDVAPQALARTLLSTLTPAEFAGSFLLTDQRLETDAQDVRRDAALELGMAMAEAMERSVIAEFPNLTGGTIGTAGSTFSWGYLLAGQTVLRNRKVPGPYSAVLHPYQYHPIAKAVTPAAAAVTNAPALQDEISGDNFFVGRLAGIDIYISANIPVDGSDDAVGAIFGRDALALDLRRAPRLEAERDASRRAWELVMSAIWDAGVWRPTYGVQLKSDASAPVS